MSGLLISTLSIIDDRAPSTSITACCKFVLSMVPRDSSSDKLLAKICCNLANASSKSLWNCPGLPPVVTLDGSMIVEVWRPEISYLINLII